ncbi:MAG: hypothetical protein ACYDD1_17090 [Caulobacteraceae bacterium]
MTLSAKITIGVTATYSGQRGLVAANASMSVPISVSLSDGTAVGQADGLFTDDTGVTAGVANEYDLASGLLDIYGASLEFSAIKVIMVVADANNASDLIVGGGTWEGPFGAAGNTLNIKPGGVWPMFCLDANGWPVAEGADSFLITSEDDAAYSLILIGVSSAISAPAYAVAPASVGAPQVGVPATFTDGDWSGNPVFAYRYKVGGTLKPATENGATYTPLAGEAGKTLSRQTVASNIAGRVEVWTAPVTSLLQRLLPGRPSRHGVRRLLQ